MQGILPSIYVYVRRGDGGTVAISIVDAYSEGAVGWEEIATGRKGAVRGEGATRE